MNRIPGSPANVARIPYLNAAPYYMDWDRMADLSEGLWTPTILPPRQLGQAAERGEVDAGLMAVADLIRLEETFEPLAIPSSDPPGYFGIANRSRVDSVLLFMRESREDLRPFASARPSADLAEEDRARLQGARIGVTGESSTSVRLLRLLLEARDGIESITYHRIVADPGEAERFDAILVIGDRALRWRHHPPADFVQKMDLAYAWNQWTGMPFVFAEWGVRRTIPEESRLWLGRFLENSLLRSESNLEPLVEGLSRELGDRSDLVEYLSNFVYRLGGIEREAVHRFHSLLEKHDLIHFDRPTPSRIDLPPE